MSTARKLALRTRPGNIDQYASSLLMWNRILSSVTRQLVVWSDLHSQLWSCWHQWRAVSKVSSPRPQWIQWYRVNISEENNYCTPFSMENKLCSKPTQNNRDSLIGPCVKLISSRWLWQSHFDTGNWCILAMTYLQFVSFVHGVLSVGFCCWFYG